MYVSYGEYINRTSINQKRTRETEMTPDKILSKAVSDELDKLGLDFWFKVRTGLFPVDDVVENCVRVLQNDLF